MIGPFLILLQILLALLFNPHHMSLLDTSEQANVLLLTAHPDDEAMFFSPTLLALTRNGVDGQPRPTVYSLCLSTGDAEGLSATRVKELERSLDILGVPNGKRWVVDSPKLRDDMNDLWDAETVADTVKPYLFKYNISHILTFDALGVSRHPNHMALPRGMQHLLTSMSTRPELYTLVTVPLLTKYSGWLGALLAQSRVDVSRLASRLGWGNVREGAVVVSGLNQYRAALNAMLEHKSQMVWFRWLYVSVSRYMWVNEWVRVHAE